MSMTRNERRKRAKARNDAKLVRLYHASEAAERDKKRLVVLDNMSSPRVRKPLTFVNGEVAGGDGYYPESSMASFAGRSHGGHEMSHSPNYHRWAALQRWAAGKG